MSTTWKPPFTHQLVIAVFLALGAFTLASYIAADAEVFGSVLS